MVLQQLNCISDGSTKENVDDSDFGTSVNGKEVTKRSATNELENYPGKKPKILFLLGEYESSDELEEAASQPSEQNGNEQSCEDSHVNEDVSTKDSTEATTNAKEDSCSDFKVLKETNANSNSTSAKQEVYGKDEKENPKAQSGKSNSSEDISNSVASTKKVDQRLGLVNESVQDDDKYAYLREAFRIRSRKKKYNLSKRLLRKQHIKGSISKYLKTLISNEQVPFCVKSKFLKIEVHAYGPTVGKIFNVTNLRSCILSDTLIRTLKQLGHCARGIVHLENQQVYTGEVVAHYQDGLKNEKLEKSNDELISEATNKLADEEFHGRAQRINQKLIEKDSSFLQEWDEFCKFFSENVIKDLSTYETNLDVQLQSQYLANVENIINELYVNDLLETTADSRLIVKKDSSSGGKSLTLGKWCGEDFMLTEDSFILAKVLRSMEQAKCDKIVFVIRHRNLKRFENLRDLCLRLGLIKTNNQIDFVTFSDFDVCDDIKGEIVPSKFVTAQQLYNVTMSEATKQIVNLGQQNKTKEQLADATKALALATIKIPHLMRYTKESKVIGEVDMMDNRCGIFHIVSKLGQLKSFLSKIKTIDGDAKLNLTDDTKRQMSNILLNYTTAVQEIDETLKLYTLTSHIDDVVKLLKKYPVYFGKLLIYENDELLMLLKALSVTIDNCFSLMGLKPIIFS